jgi:predicted nucleic acid-binding protein
VTPVDANYVLRFLVQPATPEDQTMRATAAALFRRVRAGEESITTTDAVIAEVVFILSSRRHYNRPRVDVAALLRPLLQLPGFRLSGKRRCLRALDLWAARPGLSFVDALVVVRAQELRTPLTSFDAELARIPGVTLSEPPRDEGTR